MSEGGRILNALREKAISMTREEVKALFKKYNLDMEESLYDLVDKDKREEWLAENPDAGSFSLGMVYGMIAMLLLREEDDESGSLRHRDIGWPTGSN